MKAILSADANWGIGKDNQLLVRISEDMKFFREMTIGKVVVMGKKTFISLPNGPLKDRVNIVLSSDKNFAPPGAVVCGNTEKLLAKLRKYDSNVVFVVGGEAVFRLLLPFCDTVYITRINKVFDADRFLPNLDMDSAWALAEEGEQLFFEGVGYRRCVYRRV